MSLDTTELGKAAAELMDSLAESYDGLDASIGTVAIVVEVEVTDDGPGWTSIDYRCTDGRRWLQAGLFAAAQRAVGMGANPPDE